MNSSETFSPIRFIQPQDAQAVFSILEASHQEAAVPIGPHWTLEQVAAECQEQGWVRVGEDGQIKAFVLYREAGDVWEISFLATAVDARGQGLMSELLCHLVSQCPNGQAIWLEVHEKNENARRLYERAGFVSVGKRPRYYADGGAAVLYNYG